MLAKRCNKIKVSIILLFTMLLSGCTVNYDIIITSNNKVIEKIDFFRSKEEILKNYNKIDDAKKNDKSIDILSKLNYKNRYEETKDGLSLIFDREVGQIKQLLEQSLYKNLYSNYELIKMNDYTSFKTVGDYTPAGIFTTENGEKSNKLVEQINVNIQFHNVVLESNADKVDKMTNTYTWIIKKTDSYKNIEFKFGTKKRYDLIIVYFLKSNLSTIIVMLSLIIIPTIITMIIKNKSKTVNKL